MEELTCEAKLPHINGNVVIDRKYRWTRAWYLVLEAVCSDARVARTALAFAKRRRALDVHAGADGQVYQVSTTLHHARTHTAHRCLQPPRFPYARRITVQVGLLHTQGCRTKRHGTEVAMQLSTDNLVSFENREQKCEKFVTYYVKELFCF